MKQSAQVGFICHPRINPGDPRLMEARNVLERSGYRVWTHCATPNEKPGVLAAELDGTGLLVSFGGDGTLLWTAQQAAQAGVPVLGVNAGRLGFLTQVELRQLDEALTRWSSGQFKLDRRPLLEARLPANPPYHALNEVVVAKEPEATVLQVQVDVDGKPGGRFDADGAVVFTPTGSTGYALSMGGPIIHPAVNALSFMPLNPHTLFNRPVILPDTVAISIRVQGAGGMLICDGQSNAKVEENSPVEIKRASASVELVTVGGRPTFFEVLRRKLRFGIPLTDTEGS
jgi:NAD+ kinase